MKGSEDAITAFRCAFYISLVQLLAFFLVPALVYPARILPHIEVMAALTLGLIPGLYFLIVNLVGIFADRARRPLHIFLSAAIGTWFTWAAISWATIERMDYLLH